MPSPLTFMPLLRLPLIVNDGIALPLSHIALEHWGMRWDYYRAPTLGLAVTLWISLVLSIILVLNHLYHRLQPRDARIASVPTRLIGHGITACLDLGLAIILLVLHILNAVSADKHSHPTVLIMYAAFGALIARSVSLVRRSSVY